MSNVNPISQAFLSDRPGAAALLLQEFGPEESCEFLQDIPAAVLTPVIGYMGSWPATRLLTTLPGALSAEVLSKLPEHEAETMLRLMTEEQRSRIFEYLPGMLARGFARKLVYPLSTVGAWMNTAIPLFTPDNSVGDCLDIVKRRKSHLDGVLVVVDQKRHLVGLVEAEKLLITDLHQPLVDLVEQRIEPLSANATLWEVAEFHGWSDLPTLPVADHSGVILGVLTHKALQAGTRKSNAPGDAGKQYMLVTHMAKAFVIVSTGLLQVITGASRDAFTGTAAGEAGKDG